MGKNTSWELAQYRQYLQQEEKSPITIQKYIRDTKKFLKFTAGRKITKEMTLAYKEHLTSCGYSICSVNSMLASLNSYLTYRDMGQYRVKSLRRQRQIYCPEEKELTKEEYRRLLAASESQVRLNLILQTICATGIRISELRYFTVEALSRGEISVTCKNKMRTVLIPSKLRKRLRNYAKESGISSGAIFVTRSGNPLDRSNIWSMMKRLCVAAGVNPAKVFPHNLRKLFARTFYEIEKDIAKLADILGHGNIETTRIYIMTTGIEHRRKIERLGLII